MDMHGFSRRGLLIAAAALSAAPFAAMAQSFPSRPIRLVVGYPPGGGADNLARVLAKQLGTELGQAVVVDNRPGATGTIAAAGVARSQADGYTLLLSETGMLAGNVLYPSGYDAVQSFSVVSSVGRIAFSIVTSSDFPAKTVPELIAYLKANPDKINYGTPGNGNVAHLAALHFQRKTGTVIHHIPYKGGPPMLSDLVAGQIPIGFITTAAAAGLVKAGRLRFLALTTADKLPHLPEVPTVAATVPDFDVASNIFLLAPAGTPRPIVDTLNAAMTKVGANPTVIAEFLGQGATIRIASPDAARANMTQEAAELARLIREEKVQAD